jgi:hypothetical protein
MQNVRCSLELNQHLAWLIIQHFRILNHFHTADFSSTMLMYRESHVFRNPPTCMRRLWSALWLTHFPVVRSLLLRHAFVAGSTLSGTSCTQGHCQCFSLIYLPSSITKKEGSNFHSIIFWIQLRKVASSGDNFRSSQSAPICWQKPSTGGRRIYLTFRKIT